MPVPDFIVIGAMKAGTTTLHRWLASHPDVEVPAAKELDHLSSPRRVQEGPDAYHSRFPDVRPPVRTGESSPSYLLPPGNAVAADAIARWLPDTALVAVLREPVSRLRSHHAHQVQRGRERRGIAEAATRQSVYVRASCYAACLQPYVESGLLPRTLVVTLENLVADDGGTWQTVLDHIGLAPVERPDGAHNVTAEKDRFTPLMRWMFDRGLHRPLERVPKPARTVGRRIFLRPSPPGGADGDEPVPSDALAAIEQDVARLTVILGRSAPLWSTLRGEPSP